MSFSDMIEKASQNLLGWVFISVAGGFVWVVRRVFTNQKQIEMLQKEIESRDALRKRDREDLHEVKTDVKELGRDIKRLFQTHGGNE